MENEKAYIDLDREYLERAKTIDQERKTKETEINNLRLDAQSLTSPLWNDKVQTSKNNKSMINVDKYADMEAEIKNEIQQLLDLKHEIRSKINQLSIADHRIFLINYYINCEKSDDIAFAMGYSERQGKRLHKNALKAFADQFFKCVP